MISLLEVGVPLTSYKKVKVPDKSTVVRVHSINAVGEVLVVDHHLQEFRVEGRYEIVVEIVDVVGMTVMIVATNEEVEVKAAIMIEEADEEDAIGDQDIIQKVLIFVQNALKFV